MSRKPIFMISTEGKTKEEMKAQARQAFQQQYLDAQGEDEHQDESEPD